MEPKKNPNISSEDTKSRSVFILTGLVLVVALMLCIVEYKKIDIAGAGIESSLTALEDEEVVEINPNTPPPPPPPPPPPAPPLIHLLMFDALLGKIVVTCQKGQNDAKHVQI